MPQTWKEKVINAYRACNGIAHYSEIYRYIEVHANDNLPESFHAIIRRTVENLSSDSDAFGGKEDLFFSYEGKGNGIWGLREYINYEETSIDLDANSFQISEEPPDRKPTKYSRIIRDSELIRKLKLLHNNKCQICGKQIVLKGRTYSEAHHIRPLGYPHNGVDSADNILILCPNHHAEFDFGAMAIHPDLTIISIDHSNRYNGKRITMIEEHQLNPIYLHYHFTEIFGK